MRVKIKDSEIASRLMDLLEDRVESQMNKGFSKYHHTLDECPDNDYDWDDMLNQELIDGLQYMFKMNLILRKELKHEKKRRIAAENKLNREVLKNG